LAWARTQLAGGKKDTIKRQKRNRNVSVQGYGLNEPRMWKPEETLENDGTIQEFLVTMQGRHVSKKLAQQKRGTRGSWGKKFPLVTRSHQWGLISNAEGKKRDSGDQQPHRISACRGGFPTYNTKTTKREIGQFGHARSRKVSGMGDRF